MRQRRSCVMHRSMESRSAELISTVRAGIPRLSVGRTLSHSLRRSVAVPHARYRRSSLGVPLQQHPLRRRRCRIPHKTRPLSPPRVQHFVSTLELERCSRLNMKGDIRGNIRGNIRSKMRRNMWRIRVMKTRTRRLTTSCAQSRRSICWNASVGVVLASNMSINRLLKPLAHPSECNVGKSSRATAFRERCGT